MKASLSDCCVSLTHSLSKPLLRLLCPLNWLLKSVKNLKVRITLFIFLKVNLISLKISSLLKNLVIDLNLQMRHLRGQLQVNQTDVVFVVEILLIWQTRAVSRTRLVVPVGRRVISTVFVKAVKPVKLMFIHLM